MSYEQFIDCKRCNISVTPNFVRGPFGPHEAKLVCPLCGAMLKWVSKEKNNGKRPKNKHTPESLGIDYCQLCLRPRNRLGKYETLDAHHIIEIAKGGEDVPENIWVCCTYCHQFIHQQRTYINSHTSELWEKYEGIKRLIEQANLTPENYQHVILSMSEIIGY